VSDDEIRGVELRLGLREDADILLGAEEGVVVETAPVAAPRTPAEWVRQNLFSGWVNTLITIVSGLFAGFLLYQAARFVFVSGDWEIVRRFLKGYMVGSFPLEEMWRVWACVYLVAALGGLTAGASRTRVVLTLRRLVIGVVTLVAIVAFLFFAVKTLLVIGLIAVTAVTVIASIAVGRAVGYQRLRRPLIIAWALSFPVIIVIIRFIGDGVAPRFWEGFFFNIIAATVGIFVSFPIGILLALGRRSTLPIVRLFSVGFIELFRGVPLVAWLVFSKYVVDLLLPPQMDLPDIIKGFLAMTFFSAAYVAEIVRGGLQGVDAGQYEAARALGLSTPRMLLLVVLPQALRSTIPAMISHFISLFKDTSLFVAIEVTDLLSSARRSSNAPEFRGTTMEPLLFAALVFWIVAFAMARWSQRLERRLGVGER
jgi:general L-amino acid transport system permease protein